MAHTDMLAGSKLTPRHDRYFNMIVDSFAANPGQTGDRPGTHSVPAGVAVYAIGDIHGRSDLLAELHAAIAADAARQDATRRVIVHLGDYVDRGPDSPGVIDRLMDSIPAGFESIALLGNHERMMLDFLEDASLGPLWLRNGGEATVASYGVLYDAKQTFDLQRLRGLQGELRFRLPERHLGFLRGLRLLHVEGDYAFAHAGIRPGVDLEAQEEMDLLWVRGLFLRSDRDHGKMIVHGHTIVPDPEVLPNRIGIDTGAWYTGRLTSLALHGSQRRLLATAP
jgi:serine/threonine protein phosphatase 1